MDPAASDDMRQRVDRFVLGALLAFLALNAFGGGIYAMAGAEGVPIEWLEGSGFSTYLVPGMILFALVGGATALAAIAVLARHYLALELANVAGWILITWIVVQVAIIGLVSWLQPAVALAAIAVISLAHRRKQLLAPWAAS
jgi:hypothetical protein